MTDRTCAGCTHPEKLHHGGGGCRQVDTTEAEWRLCPCRNFKAGPAAPRGTLRSIGKRGREHARRMRTLRPLVFARDGYRCRVLMASGCSGHAEHPHHVWPTGRGGPDTADNLLSVCAACHDWLHNAEPGKARMLGFLSDGG